MHRTFKATTKRLAAIAVVLIAGAVLAACGGSSTSTAATKVTTTASGSARFSSLRECLAKQGVTLPQRKPGTSGQPGGPGAGGLLGGGGSGGPALPSGVSREQFEAARKKCGATGRGRGGAGRLSSQTAKKSLTAFASCMRENGVNLPAPNTSGSGPVFNTKGVNTKSATFTAASKKCSSLLQLGAPGGGPPGAGAGAPPGSEG